MPDIVLWTQSVDRRNTWAKLLTQVGLAVDVAQESPASNDAVLLTDVDFSSAGIDLPLAVLIGGKTLQANGQQIQLPTDATEREIQLACLLATQLFQLQKQVHTEQAAHAAWAEAALTDPLTGLPNRRAWNEWLERWERIAPPERETVCVAVLDIDHFKLLNDAQGHAAGDAVLAGVAARLRSAVRRSDQVARLGGDEFGVWLPGVSVAVAGPLVERLSRAAGDASSLPPLTVSAGWAVSGAGQPGSIATLLESADQALRTAKQTRNATCAP